MSVDKSCVSIPDSVQVCQNKENATEVGLPVAQRSFEWFRRRTGKIKSSNAPTVIGLQGNREFQETWDCIGNKKAKPSKNSGTFTEVSCLKMNLQSALQVRVLLLWKNVDFTF